jgi:hypothetical protein
VAGRPARPRRGPGPPGLRRYGDPCHGRGLELIEHVVATEADPLAEDSPLMVLARAGALALMSRIELNGTVPAG